VYSLSVRELNSLFFLSVLHLTLEFDDKLLSEFTEAHITKQQCR
jgi:hypothetical protein